MKNWIVGNIHFAVASSLSAFDEKTVGSKVIDRAWFLQYLAAEVANQDFSRTRVLGQAFMLMPPGAFFTVSTGEGLRTANPDDYILSTHRGVVSAYLRREKAAPVHSLAVVVYTREAYLLDPDVLAEQSELEAVAALPTVTHVIVAVLAGTGAGTVLTPNRFVANLAGGNNEALLWSGDEIREKAFRVNEHQKAWSVVAD